MINTMIDALQFSEALPLVFISVSPASCAPGPSSLKPVRDGGARVLKNLDQWLSNVSVRLRVEERGSFPKVAQTASATCVKCQKCNLKYYWLY